MFRKLLVIAVVVLMPALASAQANRDAIAKQIETNERALNVAVQKGDVAAFKALVADDSVSMDGSGPVMLPDFLKMFSEIKLTTFTIDQVKVVFANDTAAVLTYRFTGKGSMMGMPMPSPVWASTVYANRGGKWLATFHQETLAMPMPAAKK